MHIFYIYVLLQSNNKMVTFMICIISLVGNTASQSTGYGYNCDKPEKIERLDKQYICQGQEDIKHPKKITYDLFQKPLVHDGQGFSCHMRVSDTSLLCGLWSYQKCASVPHIQEEQEI